MAAAGIERVFFLSFAWLKHGMGLEGFFCRVLFLLELYSLRCKGDMRTPLFFFSDDL